MTQLRKNREAGAITLLMVAIALAIAALVALLFWAWIEWFASPPTTTTVTPGSGPTTTTTQPPPQPPTGQPAGDLYPGGRIGGTWTGPANVKNGEEQTFTFTIHGTSMSGTVTLLDDAAVTFNIQPPSHVEIVSLNGYEVSVAAPAGASDSNGEVKVVVKGTNDPPPYSGVIVATFTRNPADAAAKQFEIQAED